ncbi:uncharacterized protein [Panulirus ornatus]|uniref:uncharacterized protein n=1 Tax=Panulirus ornatus TaxID=150431 RepID=UPI003A88986A
MRMSHRSWATNGAAPPALAAPGSLAYRRYLRYLPEYRQRGYGRHDEEEEEGGAAGEAEAKAKEDEEEEEEERGSRNGSNGGECEIGDREPDNAPDVSVHSLVRQYTVMLRARSTSLASPLTSRSCSSLIPVNNSVRKRSSSPRCNPQQEEHLHSGSENSRQGSLDSGDGEREYSPRYRSFSLPWPSDPSWRWSSDPNLMAATQASPLLSGRPCHAHPQHSSSLARLDSATSDEGCPRDDGSTGPTPPPSPMFHSSAVSRLSGLITPFKSLSPASSLGSHLGSVENLPLVRSMSVGHVLDHWVRSHSADSAVEVEDETPLYSTASPIVSLPNSPMDALRQVNGDTGVCEGACSVCDAVGHGLSDRDMCSDPCRGEGHPKCPNEDSVSGDSDASQVFSDCDKTNCEDNKFCVRDGDGGEVTVELRRKASDPLVPTERRYGGLNGEVLLRRARGYGAIDGSEGLRDRGEDSNRRVLRTPSVVISDHSGDTISLTVALASSDFSLEKLDKLQHSASSPTLSIEDDASRKVSSCSSCSSVSTVDMSTPLTLTPICRESLMEVPHRRISDCSTCSTVSMSEDEVEQILPRPPVPRKPSNWRKVRNIVQWTPFIQTYKKHKYPWVQLAGHQGNFRAGYKQGTILKKLCPAEEKALEAISADILRPYVARYTGVVEGADGEKYLQLEDLLSNFALPCVMDIKMGVRTYLEDELAKAREKPKLRKDMYEKMIQIDSKAPTEAEHKAKAVTKPRYMVWRETISSTATQGFRIEGVRRGDGTSSKDFKTTRTREQVQTALSSFLQGYPHAVSRYVQQLKSIKVTLETSPFFKTHELIGSSLLFVHNETSALVRMIDFAKTIPLPENVHITHRSPWSEGTHEDGYLLGLDNLIDLFLTLEKNITTNGEISKLVTSASSDQTNSSSSSITAISTSGNSHSALPVSAKPS